MAAGYNRIVIIGNLTRDPDYKQLASGQAVCRLGLATNRQFKNKQTGSVVQEVCYIDVDVWGAQAESCRQHLQKGRSVLVEGRLKFDTWEDQNGQTRNKHSIVADRVIFLDTQRAQSEAESVVSDTQDASQSPLEKELLDQINQVKSRMQPAKKEKSSQKKETETTSATPTGEINFKDQPPFEDDLPF